MNQLALYQPADVRQIDAAAIERCGIPGYVLMQRAAAAAYQEAVQRWPVASRWVVLAGLGNNGGDGIELARLARADGRNVQLLLSGDPVSLTGAAAEAWAAWQADDGPSPANELGDLHPEDLVVDALFGIGLSRPVEGRAARWIEAVVAAKVPVLSLDCPSGLDASSGQMLGPAIRAAVTVTFIARKLGLYLADGPDCVGEVVLADCDVPPAAFDAVEPAAQLLGPGALRQTWPTRTTHQHKGHFGHVLIVGGQAGMPGAVLMAARAALRSGAGLVSVATHPAHAALLPLAQPELMSHAMDDPAALVDLIEPATAVVCGPGLGQSEWARTLLETVCVSAGPRAVVLDADALNLLASSPVALPERSVLTPHPGEAARLLATTTANVQADRLRALSALVARWGRAVVLKGAGSWVGAPGERPSLCVAGNPGMGTGGMGDVLSGLLGAALAGPMRAGALAPLVGGAVLAHALAGDEVAERLGQAGLLPSDLIASLPNIIPRP